VPNFSDFFREHLALNRPSRPPLVAGGYYGELQDNVFTSRYKERQDENMDLDEGLPDDNDQEPLKAFVMDEPEDDEDNVEDGD
jgi:hypothetical protein